MNNSSNKSILFLGGGTAGHIYPNLAIAQRLNEAASNINCHFLVSNRSGDAKVMASEKFDYTAAPTRPLSIHPLRIAGVLKAIYAGKHQAAKLIDDLSVVAVIATGGFVSGPAVLAAKNANIPIGLVNLDAVPGKANRRIARYATQIFSAYQNDLLAKYQDAQLISLPLRRKSIGHPDKTAAKNQMGLDTKRKMLLVVGGSTGANSINQSIPKLLAHQNLARAMSNWQIVHITGRHDEQKVRDMYSSQASTNRDVTVHVMEYCEQMGDAWAAADLAISRAGASSVAEAWANKTPTIFLPYPYHKDQHQKLNAQPMVDTTGAILIKDEIQSDVNAKNLADILEQLLTEDGKLQSMSQSLAAYPQTDGAAAVAQWIKSII